MDKIFMFQESYLDIDGGIDSKLVFETISKYCRRNLDTWIKVNNERMEVMSHTEQRYDIVPVGDLEFVRTWLKLVYNGNKMKPLEIPEELRALVNRDYNILKGKDIPLEKLKGKHFIKNASELKVWNNLLYYNRDISHMIEDDINYVVSDWVNFISEYRIFVMDDKVIGCENYLGDPIVFPDENYIRKIIYTYKNCERPEAYTLDIGVYVNGNTQCTDLIEIHPFVSCGVYGFQEKELIPMLTKGFKWYVKENTL